MTEPLLLEAGRAEGQYWRDLWRYRELFVFLAWRDILVRYKQTVIGVTWAVVRPLLMTVIFTVFAGKVASLRSPADVPHALLVMAAMLPWQFFSTAMTGASNSLIGNSNLVSKVYFPRLIVPGSSVIASFVDFLITIALLGLTMAWYRFVPDWHLVALPLFILLAFGASFGAGIWLCALNVEYRDVRHIIPFVVQIGTYVSPVIFTSSDIRRKLGETISQFYALNPLVGIIDGFRWSLLCGRTTLNPWDLLICIIVVVLLIYTGLWYFRRVERTFADII